LNGVLLDTHAFLWFVFEDPRLSNRAGDVVEDPRIEKLLSIASVWEIVIKVQIGKLGLGMPLEQFVRDHIVGRTLVVLEIEMEHLLAYGALPLHHRDPFDRLLVAQAQTLNLPVVTTDPSFTRYGVRAIW
jgi:PIN domain nuclease of toxin-antitoxin system